MPLDAMGAVPDPVLLARFAGGDARAAEALTARLLPRVLAQATRMLNDRAEAEDVAQEAMLRLWRIAPGWQDGGAQVSTWLYRVTANLCLDRLRRRVPMPLEDGPEPFDPRDAPEALQDKMRAQALEQALEALAPRQRLAVVLRHLEGLANPEIAEIMEISPEAVESLTARGKRALSAALAGRREELGYDDD